MMATSRMGFNSTFISLWQIDSNCCDRAWQWCTLRHHLRSLWLLFCQIDRWRCPMTHSVSIHPLSMKLEPLQLFYLIDIIVLLPLFVGWSRESLPIPDDTIAAFFSCKESGLSPLQQYQHHHLTMKSQIQRKSQCLLPFADLTSLILACVAFDQVKY